MLEQHLEKLKGFMEIARQGSVLAAARSLGISQPALTKSLQTLEDSIGDRLFTRHSRGIQLTEVGQTLLIHCEKMFRELSDLKVRLKSSSGMSGVLSVGSYETLGVSFWPLALRQLQRDYPELRMSLTTENPNLIWPRLDQGILDMVVDAEPSTMERYFSKVLYSDQFGLYVGAKYRPRAGVIQMSYVQRAYDRDGSSIRSHLLTRGLEHELLYDFDSFVAVRAVAVENLCVGVLPVSFAAPEVRSGKLVPYGLDKKDTVFGTHRICVTCLEERRTDARIMAAFKLLKAAASRFATGNSAQ